MSIPRKTKVKKTDSSKILNSIMKQNKFINEEDMLTSIFAGQTDSVRPIGDNLNVWRYLPRSATLHFSRKTTPYTSYDYYVSFEYSNEIELPSID